MQSRFHKDNKNISKALQQYELCQLGGPAMLHGYIWSAYILTAHQNKQQEKSFGTQLIIFPFNSSVAPRQNGTLGSETCYRY